MYYIGVDLGGTNIAVGIVDENCKIIKKASVPTKPERGADAVVADMASVAKNLLLELNIPLSEVASAGVATPGTADTDRGVVVYANNIPFSQYPLADRLSSLLGGIPAYIENDANAAAKALILGNQKCLKVKCPAVAFAICKNASLIERANASDFIPLQA